MEQQGTKYFEIIRVKKHEHTKINDLVVEEKPVTIFLNDKEFVTLLCSPGKLDFLAVGFLRSEGLINSADELEEVLVDDTEGMVFIKTAEKNELMEKLYGKRTITSGCGKGTVFFNVLDSLQSSPIVSEIKVEEAKLAELMHELQELSSLFKATGGVHSAALANTEELLFFSEDIGRHNAVDKIVGECLIKGLALEDKILLSSGRLSSEIVIKGAKMKFPFIVSRSAPTSLGVELARELGITLVGFVRGGRLNIYAHEHRVL